MSLGISVRSSSIAPSVTLAIDARAKAMKAAGVDVISFSAGEPDFDTPEYVRDAGKFAIDAGHTRYTPVAGTVDLRRKICQKLKRDQSLTYDAEDIIVSAGAKSSLYHALCAIVDPGDEVIIPSPCWVSYPEMVRLAMGVPVLVTGKEENGFKPSAEDIASAVTERTKALILNSPNNPNGYVLSEAELADIASIAVEKQFYVISDEIYECLLYDGKTHISIASLGDEIKKQTIVVNGVSKTYAMTGWRIGYAAGPRSVIKAMTAYQSHSTGNPNAIAQFASDVALTSSGSYVKKMLAEFQARRDLMHALITAVPSLSAHKPEGAFYMMLNLSGIIGKDCRGTQIRGSEDFCSLLLADEHVAAVPGKAFGDDRYARLSYATSRENIVEGMRRIASFVSKIV